MEKKETFPEYYKLSIEEYQELLDAYLNDAKFVAQVKKAAKRLKKKGYAVIENLIDSKYCKRVFDNFWAATERASGGRIKRPSTPADMRNFKFKDWYPHKAGIIETAAASHLPDFYNLRYHPAVAAVFSLLWGAEERLITSLDRFNVTLPSNWLPRPIKDFKQEWVDEDPDDIGNVSEAFKLHVDQSLDKQGLHCVQGLINITDATGKGKATLELLPGSHLLHDQLEEHLGLDPKRKGHGDDWFLFTEEQKGELSRLSSFTEFRRVTAGAGALILWDSRVWHQAGRDRRPSPSKVPLTAEQEEEMEFDPRLVLYVCMQPPPASWDVAKKKLIHAQHKTTSHWPLRSKIFQPPRTYGREDLAEFDFSKEVVTAIPGRYPVVDQFSGMAPEHVFRMPHLPEGPLLKFAPDANATSPTKKRQRAPEGEEEARKLKKARHE